MSATTYRAFDVGYLIVVYGTDDSITDIPYSCSFFYGGARFFLRVPPRAPSQAVDAAKRLLRREQDVIEIEVQRT